MSETLSMPETKNPKQEIHILIGSWEALMSFINIDEKGNMKIGNALTEGWKEKDKNLLLRENFSIISKRLEELSKIIK